MRRLPIGLIIIERDWMVGRGRETRTATLRIDGVDVRRQKAGLKGASLLPARGPAAGY
jgi:hypothetical protein